MRKLRDELKVGDVFIMPKDGCYVGEEATVVKEYDGTYVRVNTKSVTGSLRKKGFGCSCMEATTSVELISRIVSTEVERNETKTNMQTLTPMQKDNMPKDMQVLYQAGFIEASLALTSRGEAQLLRMLFASSKKELITAAQEVIDEEKENK